MKYGIVISVSKTKFGPVVFKENLKENMAEASRLGYDGVELAIRKPEAINITDLKSFSQEYGLEIISIGTGQIYGEEGLNLSDDKINIRKNAVERIKKIIDIAGDFKASLIIGLVRGNIDASTDIKERMRIAEENICQSLEELLDYSKGQNINFLIEPINRYEVNIFNRLDEVHDFLSRNSVDLDLNRIGILADTFHMNIEEPAIGESIKRYSNLIKHIHFADSNRWPPGYGHIDFKTIMKILKETLYMGYISFEMLPLPDPDTAARKAIDFIKELE